MLLLNLLLNILGKNQSHFGLNYTFFSTRAVAGSFTAAIIFEVTAMALTLTLFFTAIQYEDPANGSTCVLPDIGGM